MIDGIEDINIIPLKVVWRKSDQRKKTVLSFYVNHEIRKLPGQYPEYPFDKWIMPPQLQGYLKARDHDFL